MRRRWEGPTYRAGLRQQLEEQRTFERLELVVFVPTVAIALDLCGTMETSAFLMCQGCSQSTEPLAEADLLCAQTPTSKYPTLAPVLVTANSDVESEAHPACRIHALKYH